MMKRTDTRETYGQYRRIRLADLEVPVGELPRSELPTEVAALSTETPPRVVLNFKEALVLTRLSLNTLYKQVREKKIPGVRKLGGTWRFHRQMLLDWLACK